MRSPHRLCPPTATMNLTPMIDVVFLLIIFFLVSSRLIQQEHSIALTLPTAVTAERQSQDDSVRKEIINIPAEHEILLRNRPITPAEIQAYLRSKREQGEKEIHVVIRFNRDVPSREIKSILAACAASGVWNVSFATIPE